MAEEYKLGNMAAIGSLNILNRAFNESDPLIRKRINEELVSSTKVIQVALLNTI